MEDNGIGFDEAQADRIFEPFKRLVGSRFEGSGIGLATVKRIVEAHGGTVAATSTPGQGSTFIVTLPASADTEDAQRQVSTQPKLLLVDDSEFDLDIHASTLRPAYHVFEVSSAREALEVLATHTIDVVVTDYDMPGEDGLWLLEEVERRYPAIARLLTSGGQPPDLDARLESGLVQRFLPKPLTLNQVTTGD